MDPFATVTNPEFIIRINEYVKESEKEYMQFKNEKHRSEFEKAVKGMNPNNSAVEYYRKINTPSTAYPKAAHPQAITPSSLICTIKTVMCRM